MSSAVRAVVARDAGLDAGGDHRVARAARGAARPAAPRSTAFSPAFFVTWIVTAGHVRPSSAASPPPALPMRVPRVVRRRWRAVLDPRDVAEIHRLPVVDADDELAHRSSPSAGTRRSRRRSSRCRERSCRRAARCSPPAAPAADPRPPEPCALSFVGVEQHLHDPAGAADRRHLARAGHALQLHFDRVRHLLEVVCAARRVLRPQRERDDGHVVDALRPDERLADVELRRQPVAVRQDRVVQPDDGVGARHARPCTGP